MSILLRRDPDSGYTYVDFVVNQGARWVETVVKHQGDQSSPVVDVTGWTARLTLRSTRGVLALELTADDITVDGPAGSFAWDVAASTMAASLTEPVYLHELVLLPDGDEDHAFSEFKGLVIARASVDAPVASA